VTDLNVERDAMIARMQQAVSKPADPEPAVRKKLTMEEIRSAIEAIASDDSNRDQFKALKMLAGEETSSITLPPPMSESEAVERVSRLLRPLGPEGCKIAYKKAFPASKKTIEDSVKLYMDDLDEADQEKLKRVSNLKGLYRLFPELKKPGLPTGFPAGGGLEVKAEWCKKAAARILLERKQAVLDAAGPNGPA
jgi:hypothetical protein